MAKKKPSPRTQEPARKPVFSVTRKDLIIDTFTAGGPGGQHQNTSNTAVRIRHPASGAAGECREHRSQHQNKAEALRRMVADKRFQIWKDKMLWGNPEPAEEWAEKQMAPQNLLIMARQQGKWKIID
jgi:protein subunit release factor B